MLPLQQIVINNPPGPIDWVTPTITGLSVVVVALITARYIRGSDLRKINQEDKRRWDAELVNTVVALLVITDDIASNKEQEDRKVEAIRASDIPAVLQTYMTKIRMLSNERIGDLCQETVQQYMRYRYRIGARLKELEAKDRTKAQEMLHNGDLGDGLVLNSTSGEDYHHARNTFHDAVRDLVVADEVRKAGMPKDPKWSELLAIAYGKGRMGGSGYTLTELPVVFPKTKQQSGTLVSADSPDNSSAEASTATPGDASAETPNTDSPTSSDNSVAIASTQETESVPDAVRGEVPADKTDENGHLEKKQ